MREPVLHKVPRHIVSLAAIFITFFFSISVFAIEGNDDALYSLRSQYLSSENQDDAPDLDERAPCSAIAAVIFPDIPKNQLSSDYLLEREVKLRVSSPGVFSRLNRAPPLEP